MGENGGRGKWLSPKEVVEAGLADVLIGSDDRSVKLGIMDRIKGWLNISTDDRAEQSFPVDINILHLPSEQQSHTSSIAIREGQKLVSSTKMVAKEDPSLDGVVASHNALAYAEDALKFKGR